MGAVVVPDDESDKEYRIQEAQKEREVQKERQQNLSRLSIEERDKAIRRMHSHLGLSFVDRRYLQEVRGLTDEQIIKGLYFTVNPYQELPLFIPVNFPGVSYTGKTLNNKYRGIACVTFNPQLKATGIQLRLTEEVEGGRYRWLSGTHKAHLPSGELPLTYICPAEIKSNCVGLVEGTGFKPQITADKLGQIIIGAAGGQHASSPQQLKQCLKAAKKKGVNTKLIQIYLDAGDINNKHVMNRLVNLISLLQSWNIKVEIAWWGQTTKEHEDIDELSDYSIIQYIPENHFQPLVAFKEIHFIFHETKQTTVKNLDSYLEELLAREEEEEKNAQAESEYRSFFESLQKLTSWVNTPNRQALKLKEKLAKKPSLKSIGEEIWVNFSDIRSNQSAGYRFIEYEAGQFNEIASWLLLNKIRAIIENTETGGGKSFLAANAHIANFDPFWQSEIIASIKENLLSDKEKNSNLGAEQLSRLLSPKICYFSQTGNGTIEKLNDRYVRIPVRNTATCKLIDSQHKLNELNYETGVNGNPVCHSCKYWRPKGEKNGSSRTSHAAGGAWEVSSSWCGNSAKEGEYGHLLTMREFIESDPTYWRGTPLNHPDWQEGISLSLAFFDEITTLFKAKKLEIKLADLSKLYVGLKNTISDWAVRGDLSDYRELTEVTEKIKQEEKEEAIKALSEIRDTLESLLVNPMPKDQAKYGYNYSDLEKIFGEIKGKYSQSAFTLIVQAEKAHLKKCSRALPDNPTPVDVENILPKEWFSGFINKLFLNEKENISFTLKHNLLTTYIVPKGLERLNNFPAIIGLDASGYLMRDELDTILMLAGFKEEEIVYIRVKPTVKDNVEIVQYKGAQLETRNRTDSAKEKVKSLKEQLWGKHGSNITFIDHKPYCEDGQSDKGKNEDLIMLSGDPKRGSRGSNTVYNNEVENLAQFGTPRPNLGDLRAQYECLGLETKLSFDSYLNRIILNQVMQNGGRLRANRRLEEFLKFSIFSDFDISALTEFGYTNIVIKDFNTSFPSLGSAIHKTAYQVMKYLGEAGNRLSKLTIDKVATLMDVGKSAISNLFKPYGGFKVLAEKFTNAMESLLANVNFLDDSLLDALITEELERILRSPSDYQASLTQSLTNTTASDGEISIENIAALTLTFNLVKDEIATVYDEWFDEDAQNLVKYVQETLPMSSLPVEEKINLSVDYVTDNDELENTDNDELENIKDITIFLTTAVTHGVETLIEVSETFIGRFHHLRRKVWESLKQSVKEQIFSLSSEIYQTWSG